MFKMSESLCCCEYIDRNGERSHIVASFCNCDAIDEAFDRLCSCNTVRPELITKIYSTVEDRCRIPWLRGAIKAPLYSIMAGFLLLSFIVLGSLSPSISLFTYIIVMPCILYPCHRLIQNKMKNESKHLVPTANSPHAFYYTCFAVALILPLLSIFSLIFSTSKITSMESFIIILFFVSSSSSFLAVKNICHHASPVSQDGLEDNLLCHLCSCKVVKEATHCNICRKCFVQLDHHCIWLNACIYKENCRCFMAALLLLYGYLVFHVYLTFTTICQPKKITVFFGEMLFPSHCTNAYFDFFHAFSSSVGCFVLVLLAFLTMVLLREIYWISSGKMRRGLIRKRIESLSPKFIWMAFLNCYKFWLS